MNFKTSVLKEVVFLYSQSIKKTSSSPPKICIAQTETNISVEALNLHKAKEFSLSSILIAGINTKALSLCLWRSKHTQLSSLPTKNNFRKLPYRNKKAYVKQGSYLVYFPFRVMLWALLKIQQNRKHIKKDNFLAVHSGWDLQNISAL